MEKCFNKGEVILKEGQVCKYYYFITRGCIRSFSQNNGREVNVKFYFEDVDGSANISGIGAYLINEKLVEKK